MLQSINVLQLVFQRTSEPLRCSTFPFAMLQLNSTSRIVIAIVIAFDCVAPNIFVPEVGLRITCKTQLLRNCSPKCKLQIVIKFQNTIFQRQLWV